MQKIKKTKRSEIKFLSMMFEDSEDTKQDERRAETYKKIHKASKIFSDED